MKINKIKPTAEFYGRLQHAYEHFNAMLFNSALPHCLITVQREKNTMGYFSAVRWSTDGNNDVHEIALNPGYFANRKLMEVFQTLVHEQCHLWQHEFGSPSRTGYHNWEWSEKMEAIGLMPSSTGQAGGDRVGQKMSDYVIEDGLFKQAALALVASGYHFKWVDRWVAKQEQIVNSELSVAQDAPELILPISSAEKLLNAPMAQLIPNFQHQVQDTDWQKARSKTKYSCPGCLANLWGKPDLRVRCEDCDMLFLTE
ncbi:SprT-like domain-containing protein [Undibacterium sp. TS12]|uniref:SprT-like domain-containing protein n=1 Tax=Undibacterium sp. TS12 TaxID=2908202 RepID=UPI001F4CAB89|nr:SprT-like domain-containing protein [Undibacterium sp. TS12]MCH8618522.1 SprT-like domain-containing protein [Undibacterium sp. TS12]